MDQDRKEKARENITARENSMTSLNNKKISLIDRSQCDDERLQGNTFFSQGMYQDAITCHTCCFGDKVALALPLVCSNHGKNERVLYNINLMLQYQYLTFATAMTHLKLK